MPKKEGKWPWSSSRESGGDSPALTLMESPAFRVRLGSARAARAPKLKVFIGRMKALTRKHAAGSGVRQARPWSSFGRGGSAAAGFRVTAAPQRVTVKSRVVRHSRYRGAGNAGAAIAKHIDYLGRPGVAEKGGQGVAFDATQDLSRDQLLKFRDEMIADRHHFRFIVSPEAGAALDLKAYARELVSQMEVDLGTPLRWLAAAHYDTDNPHLHLVVRGADREGQDLVINRNYMSHGMRLQAGEVATRHLGPRLPEEIERSRVQELTAERVIGIDRQLAQSAANHPQGWVSALRGSNGSVNHEEARLRTLARLQYLESVGLAREIRPGIWQPAVDILPRLQELSIRGDIIKRMHARMRGLDPATPTVIVTPRQGAASIIGRVVAQGTEDDLSDAQYLLIESRQGTVYYIALGERSQPEGRETPAGTIVRVTTAAHGKASGARIEHLSDGDLMALSHVNGVTWLDQEIAQGAAVDAPMRAGASRFEREIRDALRHRVKVLQEWQLGAEVGGQFQANPSLIGELYTREVQEAGRRLRVRYGDQVRLREGQTARGRLAAFEELPSGPHAVVTMAGRHALIPVDADLSANLGRSIALTVVRARGGLREECLTPLSVRYTFPEMRRVRRLGS